MREVQLNNPRKRESYSFTANMSKQQKKIENIYYDKYMKKASIQERIKTKLNELEKKMDQLDVGLAKLKEIDKLGERLVEDIKNVNKEKWNDLSLEMIMKKSGSPHQARPRSPRTGRCRPRPRKSTSACRRCRL